MYFKSDVIKEAEKLPIKIKTSLEKGEKIMKEDNNNNKLVFLLNDCINVENNILYIKNIKEKINKVKNFNDLNINFIPEEEEKINEFLENIKKFGEINCVENIIYQFNKSSIIKNDIENINLIGKWIKEKINKNNIRFELLFKMSENGQNSKDFHKYCDKKGPTLTIVKTNENKIFGGFTPLQGDNKGGYLKDESDQTFIFSLNLKKRFNMINKDEKAIYNGNYGPLFGNCDFGLEENMNKGQAYANSSCNFLSNNNLELIEKNGNKEYFTVENFETYKVIYSQ